MSSASSMVCRALRDVVLIALMASASVAIVRVGRGRSDGTVRQPAPPTHLVAPSPSESQPAPADPRNLRVCADPNNLPFSNSRKEGFENEIAELVARDLGKRVEYFWQPQRRGFIRTTLKAGFCDVVMGVPATLDAARTTRPYYRSSYVFVTPHAHRPRVRSLDDPALMRLQIGVELTGEDYDNPPALQALAARHMVANVHGYLVYGDYSKPDPPRRIVDAVARGEVDAAIVWGPLAGYFARHASVPLDLVPVAPALAGPGLPFVFDIAMAVRQDDVALHDALDRTIGRRGGAIRQILRRFGVPIVQTPAGV